MSVALDVRVSSGSLRVLEEGSGFGVPVLCIPGLSANARSFDAIATACAGRGRRVLALDLRGRGFSPATAPGSHGWRRHAQDIVEVARVLGLAAIDLVGHSMGAFVSMQAVALAPALVRRVVLIDAVGVPDAAAILPILASVQRLGRTYPSASVYWDSIRDRGAVAPFEDLWRAHALYELEEVPGGVRPRTSLAAVLEDMAYGSSHNASTLWPFLRLPTLLVRAGRPLPPTAGFVVSASLRDAFLAAVPTADAVDVDANHYGVVAHPAALETVAGFLGPPH